MLRAAGYGAALVEKLPSSSGLGRGPLKAQTRVRLPLGAPRLARGASRGGADATPEPSERRVTEFAFAFLDCEFGGLDPELHDITEIGVILTDYRLAELGVARVEGAARAERITRRGGADLGLRRCSLGRREGHPYRCLAELSAMLPKGRTVVPAGQNVRMDVMFLERAYKNCALPYPFDYHVIDLATLYYAWSLVEGETVARALAAAGRDDGRAGGGGGRRIAHSPTRGSPSRRSATSWGGWLRDALLERPGAQHSRPARGCSRCRHFSTASQVVAREQRQQPARGETARAEADRRREVDQDRLTIARRPARCCDAADRDARRRGRACCARRPPAPSRTAPRHVR